MQRTSEVSRTFVRSRSRLRANRLTELEDADARARVVRSRSARRTCRHLGRRRR
jgi:hypothetical protein